MASYTVLLKPSVEKDLRAITPAQTRRIWPRIESLSTDPHPRQSVKLSGAERLYRLRVGDYRIVYSLDEERMLVVVHYVRHRSQAYRHR
jgi:mRNA interferase RelE/StbE